MRKTKDITITAEGRDHGKTFRITEMPALKAEKWAWRLLLGMSRGGVDIPPDAMEMGMAGIAVVGIRALTSIPFADAEPLLDEMMACVQITPSPNVTRALNETAHPDTVNPDIEEVKTHLLLRGEVMDLHTGFSITATLSRLGAAVKQTAGNTSPRPTSHQRSQRRSSAAKRRSPNSKPSME